MLSLACWHFYKLSSSSAEESDSSSHVESSSDSEELCGAVCDKYEPYTHKPLAKRRWNNEQDLEQDEDASSSYDDLDVDGISPRILAERYEQNIAVNEWCKCGQCAIEKLVGSVEYRRCPEVVDTLGKMVFDCYPTRRLSSNHEQGSANFSWKFASSSGW